METLPEDIMYIIIKKTYNLKKLNLMNKTIHVIIQKYIYNNFYYFFTNESNKIHIKNVVIF